MKAMSTLDKCDRTLNRIYHQRLTGEGSFFPHFKAEQQLRVKTRCVLHHHSFLEFNGDGNDSSLIFSNTPESSMKKYITKVTECSNTTTVSQNTSNSLIIEGRYISASKQYAIHRSENKGNTVKIDNNLDIEKAQALLNKLHTKLAGKKHESPESQCGRIGELASGKFLKQTNKPSSNVNDTRGKRTATSNIRTHDDDNSKQSRSIDGEDEKINEILQLFHKTLNEGSKTKNTSLSEVQLSSRLMDTSHRKPSPCTSIINSLKSNEVAVEGSSKLKEVVDPTKKAIVNSQKPNEAAVEGLSKPKEAVQSTKEAIVNFLKPNETAVDGLSKPKEAVKPTKEAIVNSLKPNEDAVEGSSKPIEAVRPTKEAIVNSLKAIEAAVEGLSKPKEAVQIAKEAIVNSLKPNEAAVEGLSKPKEVVNPKMISIGVTALKQLNQTKKQETFDVLSPTADMIGVPTYPSTDSNISVVSSIPPVLHCTPPPIPSIPPVATNIPQFPIHHLLIRPPPVITMPPHIHPYIPLVNQPPRFNMPLPFTRPPPFNMSPLPFNKPCLLRNVHPPTMTHIAHHVFDPNGLRPRMPSPGFMGPQFFEGVPSSTPFNSICQPERFSPPPQQMVHGFDEPYSSTHGDENPNDRTSEFEIIYEEPPRSNICNYEKISVIRDKIETIQRSSELNEIIQKLQRKFRENGNKFALKNGLLCKTIGLPNLLYILLPNDSNVKRDVVLSVIVQYPELDFENLVNFFEKSFFNMPLDDIEHVFYKRAALNETQPAYCSKTVNDIRSNDRGPEECHTCQIVNYEKLSFMSECLIDLQKTSELLAIIGTLQNKTYNIQDEYVLKCNLLCKKRDCGSNDLLIVLPKSTTIYREIVSKLSDEYPTLDFTEFISLVEFSFSYVTPDEIHSLAQRISKSQCPSPETNTLLNNDHSNVINSAKPTTSRSVFLSTVSSLTPSVIDKIHDSQMLSTVIRTQLKFIEQSAYRPESTYFTYNTVLCRAVSIIGGTQLCVVISPTLLKNTITALHGAYPNLTAEEFTNFVQQFIDVPGELCHEIINCCNACQKSSVLNIDKKNELNRTIPPSKRAIKNLNLGTKITGRFQSILKNLSRLIPYIRQWQCQCPELAHVTSMMACEGDNEVTLGFESFFIFRGIIFSSKPKPHKISDLLPPKITLLQVSDINYKLVVATHSEYHEWSIYEIRDTIRRCINVKNTADYIIDVIRKSCRRCKKSNILPNLRRDKKKKVVKDSELNNFYSTIEPLLKDSSHTKNTYRPPKVSKKSKNKMFEQDFTEDVSAEDYININNSVGSTAIVCSDTVVTKTENHNLSELDTKPSPVAYNTNNVPCTVEGTSPDASKLNQYEVPHRSSKSIPSEVNVHDTDAVDVLDVLTARELRKRKVAVTSTQLDTKRKK